MDQLFRLSRITVGLHWIIALSMILLLVLGLYMVENEAWHLYHLHKSIGIIVFPIAVLRLMWRFKTGWPGVLSPSAAWQLWLSKAAHYVLLLLTLLMPISGMVFSAASGHGFGIFSWQIVAPKPSLIKPGEVEVISEFWMNLGHRGHELLGTALLVVLLAHVVGALKHQILDKDGVLKRMLGMRVG